MRAGWWLACCAVMFAIVYFSWPEATESVRALPVVKDELTPESTCDPDLSAAGREHGRSIRCFSIPRAESSSSATQVALAAFWISGDSKLSPLLVLAGGPGDAWGPHLPRRLGRLLAMSGERGVLVVDQRGTGRSKPLLDCPDSEVSSDALARCRKELATEHDLSAYNTDESSNDLNFVLAKLGVARVAVYGISYGTRLARRFASLYPGKVEAVVLDSAVPSGDVLTPIGQHAQEAMGRVLELCSASTACSRDRGPTLSDFSRVAVLLEHEPSTDAPTANEWVLELFHLLYEPQTVALVPLLVRQAKRGDFTLFYRLRELGEGGAFSFGVHLSIQCSEHFFETSPQTIREAQAVLLPGLDAGMNAAPYIDYCRIWDVPTRNGKESDVLSPTLVLHGAFDPVTPLEYARRVASQIEGSTFVELKGESHGAALSPCGSQVVRAFLKGENATDHPCTSRQEWDFVEAQPSEIELRKLAEKVNYRL